MESRAVIMYNNKCTEYCVASVKLFTVDTDATDENNNCRLLDRSGKVEGDLRMLCTPTQIPCARADVSAVDTVPTFGV